MRKLVELDRKILLHLQGWRKPLLNRFFLFVTMSGTGRFWIAFSSVLIILTKLKIHFLVEQPKVTAMLLAPFIAFVLGRVIKNAVKRKRPSIEIPRFQQLIKPPTCGSFPSNHTSSLFAFYSGLVLIGHPLASAAGIWAGAVAFSRLYLGVHYFTDVVGGVLVGAISSYVLLQFIQL